MCMWQSQAFGGAFSFGGSVPDDHGTASGVCPVEASNPPAVMMAAPMAFRKVRRANPFPMLLLHATQAASR
jgi:hypothetical protein